MRGEQPQSHGLDTQEMDRREKAERKQRTGAPIGKCPYCGQTPVYVVDTRLDDDGVVVNRRRRCATCGKRWVTREVPVGTKIEEKAAHIGTVRAEARRLVRSLLERLGDE